MKKKDILVLFFNTQIMYQTKTKLTHNLRFEPNLGESDLLHLYALLTTIVFCTGTI